MIHKVKYTHRGNGRSHINRAGLRDGREVYRHPKGYFVVLEFEGKSGKFREAFWPEQIIQNQ